MSHNFNSLWIPEGISLINQNIGFLGQGSTITHIYGNLPVFSHDIGDMPSFRMLTSQLNIYSSASQAEICRAFGTRKCNGGRYPATTPKKTHRSAASTNRCSRGLSCISLWN